MEKNVEKQGSAVVVRRPVTLTDKKRKPIKRVGSDQDQLGGVYKDNNGSVVVQGKICTPTRSEAEDVDSIIQMNTGTRPIE